MFTEYYKRDQALNVVPFCPKEPDWVIIGGPANGNEGQVFKKSFPNCQMIGCEPNTRMVEFQKEHEFPGEILNCALWSTSATIKFYVDNDDKCGSMRERVSREVHAVQSVTIDELSDRHGGFEKAILWIDIEGAELECLRGAKQTLKRKGIKTINLEAADGARGILLMFLKTYGYKLVHEWNQQRVGGRHFSDMIFRG